MVYTVYFVCLCLVRDVESIPMIDIVLLDFYLGDYRRSMNITKAISLSPSYSAPIKIVMMLWYVDSISTLFILLLF